MSQLPVIIGMGGVNPAGRTSFHYGYQRMIFDALGESSQQNTLNSLGSLMGVSPSERDYILQHTLIRKLENAVFDGDNIPLHRRLTAESDPKHPLRMTVKRKHLPLNIPDNWTISDSPEEGLVTVEMKGSSEFLIPDTRVASVKSCGQLPTGFSAESLYPSRHHPKALAMTVYGASDAIGSLGIDWELIRQRLDPDQIGVYAGSGMSQLDTNGYGGMMQARLLGKQVTPKSLPLGLPEMPADFINAYVIGNVGHTGCNIGACATFLYNLRQGLEEIKSGRRRLVIVGNSETGLVPEVFEGYGNMGALATDAELLELDKDKGLTEPDYQRASRPFSYNAGFTLAESAQFFILCDDELALELGATIYGAVPEVHVHADGFKKSIPSPGVGTI
ncbi:MAG: beta-ketoacyl synthase [Pseudomonadales bacterium]|nr:beta-ketoacyl synthase [Pseudomonadales bacterium]